MWYPMANGGTNQILLWMVPLIQHPKRYYSKQTHIMKVSCTTKITNYCNNTLKFIQHFYGTFQSNHLSMGDKQYSWQLYNPIISLTTTKRHFKNEHPCHILFYQAFQSGRSNVQTVIKHNQPQIKYYDKVWISPSEKIYQQHWIWHHNLYQILVNSSQNPY